MRFNRIVGVLCRFSCRRRRRAPAFAQTPYDGLWHVTIVTKSGTCERRAQARR